MQRRQFLLFSFVGLLVGSGILPKLTDRVMIRDGWILLESDLK